jgi:hypothetical protein
MSRDLLAGLRPPPPAAELRARVLAAAQGSAPTVPSRKRESLLDQLWAARWLRLAWLGTVLVLLALHADLAGRDVPTRVPTPTYAESVGEGGFDFFRPRPAQWTLAQFRHPTTEPGLGL